MNKIKISVLLLNALFFIYNIKTVLFCYAYITIYVGSLCNNTDLINVKKHIA